MRHAVRSRMRTSYTVYYPNLLLIVLGYHPRTHHPRTLYTVFFYPNSLFEISIQFSNYECRQHVFQQILSSVVGHDGFCMNIAHSFLFQSLQIIVITKFETFYTSSFQTKLEFDIETD